jgi:hypothetical protein
MNAENRFTWQNAGSEEQEENTETGSSRVA